MAFGTPASTGFNFGAPASGGFGAPASSAPAFGATSTPAFGASSSSGGSALFGATPAFGAAPSSAPAFGATNSPSLFGGASGSPSPFGTPGSTPAFGTPGSSAPAFGTPAGSSPGLFGASSSAPASTGGAFSFGAAPAAGAAPFGSSVFGAQSAPQPSTGLFGQQPQQQQQPQGNMFALTLPQQQQQQQQQQLQQQQQQQQQSLKQYQQQQEYQSMQRELEALVAAYNPTSPGFKFQSLFMNVVDNPQQRVKPPGLLDENKWKQASKNNNANLWPVLASGFSDLLQRGEVQAAANAENRERMRMIKELAHKLRLRLVKELASQVAVLRERHLELTTRLLALARNVYGLEGRFALYSGRGGDVSRSKDAQLSSQLDAVEAQLSLTSPSGLQPRMEALKAASRLVSSSPLSGMDGSAGIPVMTKDHPSVQQAFSVLQEHSKAIQHLQAQLQRDFEDLAIMQGRDGSSGTVSTVVEYTA